MSINSTVDSWADKASRSLDWVFPSASTNVFEPPRQRQRWGENQVLPHINWDDLFFDLFYVAAAYNLSKVLMYSPCSQGILYLAGLFGPILAEWFTRTFFDARFSWGTDPVHAMVEVVRLCSLATAVVHIREVDAMSRQSKYPDMFGFSLGALCLSICNIYVCLEVNFKVVGEKAAKISERANVISYMIQGAFYLAATCISGARWFRNTEGGENDQTKLVPYISNACTRFLTETGDLEAYPSRDDETSTISHVPIILCTVGWVFGVLFWVFKWMLIPIRERKNWSVPLNVECK